MKKRLALLLSLVMVFSLFGVSAFGAVKRASSVRISVSPRTISYGQTVSPSFDVSPSGVAYDKVVWESEDDHIVELSDYDEFTGITSGTATIRVRLYMTDDETSRSTLVGSGTTTITVVGSGSTRSSSSSESSGIDYTASSGSSSSGSSRSSTSSTLSNGAISTSEVTDAISAALRQGDTSAKFTNYDTITANVLRSAASAAKGGFQLHFDTKTGTSVEGRISINPADAAKLDNTISLGLYTNEEETSSVSTKFQSWFTNDLAVAKAAHTGDYGITVRMAVRIGSDLASASRLRVYRYTPSTNTYSELKGANLSVDENGYAHFDTSVGAYFIISSGALSKS